MADTEIPSYNFNHKYRGYAVIIVNKNFGKYEGEKLVIINPELKRNGSSKDRKKMKDLFLSLDFKVKRYKDLTAEKMRKKIIKASQNEKYNKQSDCFALVISSHGEEVQEKKAGNLPKGAEVWRHRVLGSDCEPVYIDEMMEFFRNDEAKELAGKPKIFIIQACRSRHNTWTKRYDYGVSVNVKTDSREKGQPSDAGDHCDSAMLKNIGLEGIEDVNADWSDQDSDECTSDTETESSDDDSYVDSDEDLPDAKGSQDSGVLPPSPGPLVPAQPSQSGQLPHPALPRQDDQQVKPLSPLEDEQPQNKVTEDQSKSSQDFSNWPSSSKEYMRSKGTGVAPSAPEDEPDVKFTRDTGAIRPSPFDVVPINCPSDCILVYPVMSGFIAFRRFDLGSRLLHCMDKKENLQKLVEGCDFLQYMTSVCADMARVEVQFEPDAEVYTPVQIQELKQNMPFKVSTVLMHRLQGRVVLKPKTDKSFMAAVVKKLKLISV